MVNKISSLIMFLVILFQIGCQKTTLISKVSFKGEGIKTNINEEVKVTSQELICKEYEVILSNKSDSPLEILIEYQDFNFYGIGCQVIFESKLNALNVSQLKLHSHKYRNFGSSPLLTLTHVNKIKDKLLEDKLGNKIVLDPNEDYQIYFKFTKEIFKFLPVIVDSSKNDIKSSKETTFSIKDSWSIKLKPHFIIVYRYLNEPNKVYFENQSGIKFLVIPDKEIEEEASPNPK